MKKQSQKTVSVQTPYGKYLCLLEPDEKKGFIVTVPGLSGVITWGKNVARAKEMVKEAIELCVECRVEETLGKTKTRPRVSSKDLARA